jgi:hypothetical protein
MSKKYITVRAGWEEAAKQREHHLHSSTRMDVYEGTEEDVRGPKHRPKEAGRARAIRPCSPVLITLLISNKP